MKNCRVAGSFPRSSGGLIGRLNEFPSMHLNIKCPNLVHSHTVVETSKDNDCVAFEASRMLINADGEVIRLPLITTCTNLVPVKSL